MGFGKDATRRLTILYISALATVGLLGVLGQVLFQQGEEKNVSDVRVLAVAGRQRMLTERVAKLAIAVELAKDDASRKRWANELVKTVQVWENNQRALLYGDPVLQLSRVDDPSLLQLFSVIDAPFDRMASAANELAQSVLNPAAGSLDGKVQATLTTRVRDEEGMLQAQMEALSDAFAAQAEIRLADLRQVQLMRLIIVLVVLAIAGGLVIRPAVRELGKSFVQLTEAQDAIRQSEERYRLMSENSTDIIARLSADGVFVYVSPAVRTLLGYETTELLGTSIVDLVHPEDLASIKSAVLGEHRGGNGGRVTYRVRTKAGEWTWFETSSRSITTGGEAKPLEILTVSRDVSDRKRAEEALHEANANLNRWVGELEQRNHEITMLTEMTELLHSSVTPKDAYRVVTQFIPRLFPRFSGALYIETGQRNLLEAVAQWGDLRSSEVAFPPLECWALRRGRMYLTRDAAKEPSCQHFAATLSGLTLCVPMMAQGQTQGVLCLYGADLNAMAPGQSETSNVESFRRLALTFVERLELSLANLRLQEDLRAQSIRDPLTGLFNRRYMEESLERELRRAARNNRSVGILMLDLDHFKDFNDSYGHSAGDLMLTELSTYLTEQIRGGDIACRFGGEEIILIMPDTTLTEAAARAEQICSGIAGTRVEYREEFLPPITVSIGVAAFPEHGEKPEQLLHTADTALYRAKERGRNQVVVAEPGTRY